ncbi:MAG: penicillin-binding protein 2 [Thermoleophilia bacterium]|nr:penicillin-binding protein 2 [Thermoleophilia bacterium]
MPFLLSNGSRKNNERKAPSLALRVGVLGAVAVLLFAVLIFRIWFLQILSGEEYVAMAENNRIRYIPEEAPRGIVYDRNRQPLVENRAGLAVTVFPPALENPQKELEELGAALGMPVEDIYKQLELHKNDTYRSVVVKKDISPETKSFIIERIPLYFPGVDIKKLPLRDYPNGTQAVHLLGHVGQIDEQDLDDPNFEGQKAGDDVGKDGVEYQFDRYLRGADGGREVEVDASGRPKRELRSITAQSGNNVILSLDMRIQKEAEEILASGIDLAHSQNFSAANGGAAVVMNPKTGEVYAMASYPSYDPKVWVGGISSEEYQSLTSEWANDPLLNRVTSAQYPPASTFKVVTAIAGLEEGMINPLTNFVCTGVWDVLSQPFKCWGVHGREDLHSAIVDSCDTYFYNVGYRFYQADNLGIQRWAREMGMGRQTGIDLPGEATGRVPDPEWKELAGETEVDQMWLPGDSVNLSIGQGDMLATPLQLANAYSIIANDGLWVKPHVGLWVEDKYTSGMLADLQPDEKVQLPISMEHLKPIQEGLVDAARPGAATVGDAFAGFPMPVAGKTGTAEVAGKTDYAWFAAYAPVEDPQVVVVVLIEQGGGGGKVAAPTVRRILEAFFAAPPGPAVAPGG